MTASRQGTLSTHQLHALLLPMREPIGDASMQLVSVVVAQSLVDDLGDGFPRRTRRASWRKGWDSFRTSTQKSYSLLDPFGVELLIHDSYGMVALQTTTKLYSSDRYKKRCCRYVAVCGAATAAAAVFAAKVEATTLT